MDPNPNRYPSMAAPSGNYYEPSHPQPQQPYNPNPESGWMLPPAPAYPAPLPPQPYPVHVNPIHNMNPDVAYPQPPMIPQSYYNNAVPSPLTVSVPPMGYQSSPSSYEVPQPSIPTYSPQMAAPIGMLGSKDEKKRLKKMQKEQEKLEKKQKKGMKYMH